MNARAGAVDPASLAAAMLRLLRLPLVRPWRDEIPEIPPCGRYADVSDALHCRLSIPPTAID